jgi:hypothetical protein
MTDEHAREQRLEALDAAAWGEAEDGDRLAWDPEDDDEG